VLYFDIKANSKTIGSVVIRRLEPIPPNGISEYRATVNYKGGVSTFVLKHRWDDGALVLIEKVLRKVTTPPRRILDTPDL
jgi:hypothetical protein